MRPAGTRLDLERFRQLPLLGILRGIEAPVIAELTEHVVASGLTSVEITMNTPGAAGLIENMVGAARGRLMVGAGTVLTVDDLKAALDAGATFIVLPTLVGGVVERCVRDGIPVFPGALTPQEIHDAWAAGATMVKVFPAKVFGPEYFREIRGPFRDVELLACGGVSVDTIDAYFAAGASAVAFGASVFRADWLARRELTRVEESLRALVAAFRQREHVRSSA